MLKCYTPSACQGASAEDYNPHGHCYIGYRGILCAQCEPDYVRNASFQCAKCPARWRNIVLMAVLFLVIVVVVVFFIKGTLTSMKRKKSNVPVYFKILANHFQLIALTLNFDLEWPGQVEAINDTARPVADVSARIISLDCFLGGCKLFCWTSLSFD